MTANRSRNRARHLFGGGLIFFVVGIVLDQVAVTGLAFVMLVSALVWHTRAPKPSDQDDTAA